MKYRGICYEKGSAGAENAREAAGTYRGTSWQRKATVGTSAKHIDANLSYRGVGYHVA